MNKIRVAVVGAGHLGKIHARLLANQERAELTAIADPSPRAQRELLKSADQKNIAIVGDYRKIIGDIDAAIVATPTRSHFEIATELLANQIHTLIEKPITACPYEGRRLLQTASENRCVVSVGHVEQHNPVFAAAMEIVGVPKFIQATRTSGYTYRSTDIGVVHDLMIHDIDLVNSIFPGGLKETRACGFSVFDGQEDIAQARLQFDCGGIANLTASRCSFSPERSIQIFGTAGFASLDLAKHELKAIRIPNWIKNRQFDFSQANPEQRKFVREQLFEKILPVEIRIPDKVNAIEAEQREWLNAIADGSRMKNTGENAVAAVQIADQILGEIESHSWNGIQPGPNARFDHFADSITDDVPNELRPSASSQAA